jgi:hypothetical protein
MAKTSKFMFLEENFDEIHSQVTQKTFLSREFLTWLWFFAEQHEGRFELELNAGTRKKAQLWLDDRIVLAAKTGRSHEHIIKGGVPSTSDEAGICLKSGKAVKELKIALEVDGLGLFSATLSGDEAIPKGLRLPEPDEQSDQTVLEQRIASLAIFNQAIDQLFAKFMDDRTSNIWDTNHLGAIKSWIQSRSHDTTTVH